MNQKNHWLVKKIKKESLMFSIKKKSIIWDYFTIDSNFVICNNCKKQFSISSSTSTLKRHLSSSHQIELPQKSPQKRKEVPILDSKIQDIATEDLVKWIIDDFQSFIVVENLYFEKFTQHFGYQLPGKTFIKNKIMKCFEDGKKQIIDMFRNTDSKISITLDLWTSTVGTPYIGITAHWVNSNWKLCSISLDFLECPFSHDGENLSNIVFEIVKDFGISTKIIVITTDNASNMTSFYNFLYEKIKLYSPHVTHFGCGCHIINLAV